MGRKENPLLVYYNQNERFAQLLNGWLFRGGPAWKRRYQRGRPESGRKEWKKRKKKRIPQADTAICTKGWTARPVRLYVGAEPMEYVDYAMPLRVMDSDTLSYLHQKKEISRKYAEHKGLEGDEYLSPFYEKRTGCFQW